MKEFDGKVALFSNSIGSSNFDPDFLKADLFTEATGIQVIRHNSKVKIFHFLAFIDSL